MREFIFQHYVLFAQLAISLSLLLVLIGVGFNAKKDKIKRVTITFLSYLGIVSLGMSSDIKHLSYIGIAHGLIALTLAYSSVRYLALKSAYLLYVPCLFILLVVLFNLFNQNSGLELMGRWIDG